jgi:hypothetical protein
MIHFFVTVFLYHICIYVLEIYYLIPTADGVGIF